MKAILEFDLPTERVEHLWAVHAPGLADAILAVDRQLRDWLKHGCLHESPNDAFQQLRDLLDDVREIAYGEP